MMINGHDRGREHVSGTVFIPKRCLYWVTGAGEMQIFPSSWQLSRVYWNIPQNVTAKQVSKGWGVHHDVLDKQNKALLPNSIELGQITHKERSNSWQLTFLLAFLALKQKSCEERTHTNHFSEESSLDNAKKLGQNCNEMTLYLSWESVFNL